MPLELKLLLLFVAGACAGRIINFVAWRLTVDLRPHPSAPARLSRRDKTRKGAKPPEGWRVWVPMLAAWRCRSTVPGFRGPSGWRPLIVEIALAVAFVALYWWEVDRAALVQALLPQGFVLAPADHLRLELVYFGHVLLIVFMLTASLVDIDEQLIPDVITVPGTLIGLLLAAFCPRSLLPVVETANNQPALDFLTVATPHAWPASLAGAPNFFSLCLALFCYLGWCAALLPWRLRTRRGTVRGLRLMIASWLRDPMSLIILGLAALGSLGIAAAWWGSGDAWRGLLSALVGMASGGVLIWAARIVSGWALGREAMGFGDVTLMAMICGFLGWQLGPFIFFLAPLAGLVVGLIQWIIYRDNVIPYGPFLCLATVAVIIIWGPLWAWAEPLFEEPLLVPGAMIACTVLLAVLLGLLRAVRVLLGGGR